MKRRKSWRMSCDVGEVPMTQVKQQKGCIMRCAVGTAAEGSQLFSNPSAALPTAQLIIQPFCCFTYVIGTSPTSPGEPPMPNSSAASSTPQLILQPFRRFTYVTGHSTTLPLLHLHHRYFTYFTWQAAHAQGDEKTVCGGLACYNKLLSLEVATVLDS